MYYCFVPFYANQENEQYISYDLRNALYCFVKKHKNNEVYAEIIMALEKILMKK